MIPVMSSQELLKRKEYAIPADLAASARKIVDAVRQGNKNTVENYAREFDRWDGKTSLIYSREDCLKKLNELDSNTQQLLENIAGRIRIFAEAQRKSFSDFTLPSMADGITMGIRYEAVERIGCYAPGGRYPLISSALMTVIPARIAGARKITLATPNPAPVMLAAAAIAGADQVLAIGGAQAIATLAYGAEMIEPCDMIVGPGNQWVAAAKQYISADRGIDFLAGPSELLIIADDSADPEFLAADLLAQAEHDIAAVPNLLTNSEKLIECVKDELKRQSAQLPEPNRSTAIAALKNGAICLVSHLNTAIMLSNQLAPEHVQLITRDDQNYEKLLTNYGSLFIGAYAAEVFGDYGIGPNHTLPTAGAARFSAGLSVASFLKPRSYIRASEQLESVSYNTLVTETAAMARLEGLEAHARAAEIRKKPL